MFGEPHFVTPDHNTYGFNPIGEFYVVKSNNGGPLNIQARFAQCSPGSPATCVGGLSFGFGGTPSVSITYDHATGITKMFQGSTDVTASLPITVNGVTFVHRQGLIGGDYRITDTANGYVVTWLINGQSWPSVILCLSVNLFGTVGGLMGNFDGNFVNDFQLQGGSTISSLSNFTYLASSFGESWRVTAQTSVFYYASGESYASKNDPSFQPFVFNPATFTPSPQAQAACQGLQDDFLQGCLFDVTVTGDTDFAHQANMTSQSYNAQEASYRGTASDATVGAGISLGFATISVALACLFL